MELNYIISPMEGNYENIKINEYSINIYHDSSYGYAGLIWDCAYVFSNFISSEKLKKHFKNKTILEVGSGTGICGLIAACLESKKIYLTDREENLKILEKNLEINKDNLNANCEVCIRALDWNYIVDFRKIEDKFDIIIASDIIYHGVNYPSIINLLDYFCNDKTVIILGYNHRISSSYEFFEAIENDEKWEVKKISSELINSEEYTDENIIIVMIKKKGKCS